MATGIKPIAECIELYNKLKLTGDKRKPYDFLVMHIDDATNKVVPDVHPDFKSTLEMDEYKNVKDQPASFKRFKDYLVTKSSAYAFYHFEWEEKDGVKNSDFTMIAWCNDNKANVTQKMKFSGTKDQVKKALQVGRVLQCNDIDDLDYKTIIKELSKNKAKM